MTNKNNVKWKKLLHDLESEFNMYTNLHDALSAIDKYILDKNRNVAETFDLISEQVAKVLSAENVQILQATGHDLLIVSSTLQEHIGNHVDINSVSGQCLISKKPINIIDITSYSGSYEKYFGSDAEPMKSELAVPIFVGENELPFGVINIESTRKNAYDETHVQIVESISRQASIAIEHTNIIDESEFTEDTRKLLKNDVELNDIKIALDKYSKKISKTLYASFSESEIAFVDGPYLEIVFTRDNNNYGLKVPIENSVAGDAVRSKKTINYGNLSNITNYKKLSKKKMNSEIAVPILIQDEVIAVINVESASKNAFSKIDQYMLERFSKQTSDLVALIRLQWMRYKALEKRSSDAAFIAVTDKIGNLVHRLNNIASSIKNNALSINEYFIDENDCDPKDDNGGITINDLINNIIISADKALQIPKELKKNIIDGEIINPNTIIKNVVKLIINENKNIRINVNYDKELKKMNLFSFDIVVETLVKNSVDAIIDKNDPNGHIQITTNIIDAAGDKNKYFSFKIEDNGSGIKQENMNKIYNPNFTTKEGKTGSGLGYGLWWVKSFVTRNSGYIMVESTYDIGTKFEIRIPINY